MTANDSLPTMVLRHELRGTSASSTKGIPFQYQAIAFNPLDKHILSFDVNGGLKLWFLHGEILHLEWEKVQQKYCSLAKYKSPPEVVLMRFLSWSSSFIIIFREQSRDDSANPHGMVFSKTLDVLHEFHPSMAHPVTSTISYDDKVLAIYDAGHVLSFWALGGDDSESSHTRLIRQINVREYLLERDPLSQMQALPKAISLESTTAYIAIVFSSAIVIGCFQADEGERASLLKYIDISSASPSPLTTATWLRLSARKAYLLTGTEDGRVLVWSYDDDFPTSSPSSSTFSLNLQASSLFTFLPNNSTTNNASVLTIHAPHAPIISEGEGGVQTRTQHTLYSMLADGTIIHWLATMKETSWNNNPKTHEEEVHDDPPRSLSWSVIELSRTAAAVAPSKPPLSVCNDLLLVELMLQTTSRQMLLVNSRTSLKLYEIFPPIFLSSSQRPITTNVASPERKDRSPPRQSSSRQQNDKTMKPPTTSSDLPSKIGINVAPMDLPQAPSFASTSETHSTTVVRQDLDWISISSWDRAFSTSSPQPSPQQNSMKKRSKGRNEFFAASPQVIRIKRKDVWTADDRGIHDHHVLRDERFRAAFEKVDRSRTGHIASSQVMNVLNEWWPYIDVHCVEPLRIAMKEHEIDEQSMITMGLLAKVAASLLILIGKSPSSMYEPLFSGIVQTPATAAGKHFPPEQKKQTRQGLKPFFGMMKQRIKLKYNEMGEARRVEVPLPYATLDLCRGLSRKEASRQQKMLNHMPEAMNLVPSRMAYDPRSRYTESAPAQVFLDYWTKNWKDVPIPHSRLSSGGAFSFSSSSKRSYSDGGQKVRGIMERQSLLKDVNGLVDHVETILLLRCEKPGLINLEATVEAVYRYFLVLLGVPEVVCSRLDSLYQSVLYYEDLPTCRMFRRLLGLSDETLTPELRYVYLSCRRWLGASQVILEPFLTSKRHALACVKEMVSPCHYGPKIHTDLEDAIYNMPRADRDEIVLTIEDNQRDEKEDIWDALIDVDHFLSTVLETIEMRHHYMKHATDLLFERPPPGVVVVQLAKGLSRDEETSSNEEEKNLVPLPPFQQARQVLDEFLYQDVYRAGTLNLESFAAVLLKMWGFGTRQELSKGEFEVLQMLLFLYRDNEDGALCYLDFWIMIFMETFNDGVFPHHFLELGTRAQTIMRGVDEEQRQALLIYVGYHPSKPRSSSHQQQQQMAKSSMSLLTMSSILSQRQLSLLASQIAPSDLPGILTISRPHLQTSRASGGQALQQQGLCDWPPSSSYLMTVAHLEEEGTEAYPSSYHEGDGDQQPRQQPTVTTSVLSSSNIDVLKTDRSNVLSCHNDHDQRLIELHHLSSWDISQRLEESGVTLLPLESDQPFSRASSTCMSSRSRGGRPSYSTRQQSRSSNAYSRQSSSSSAFSLSRQASSRPGEDMALQEDGSPPQSGQLHIDIQPHHLPALLDEIQRLLPPGTPINQDLLNADQPKVERYLNVLRRRVEQKEKKERLQNYKKQIASQQKEVFQALIREEIQKQTSGQEVLMKKQKSLKGLYGQEVKRATREQQEATAARDKLLMGKQAEMRHKRLGAKSKREEEAQKLRYLQAARQQLEEQRRKEAEKREEAKKREAEEKEKQRLAEEMEKRRRQQAEKDQKQREHHERECMAAEEAYERDLERQIAEALEAEECERLRKLKEEEEAREALEEQAMGEEEAYQRDVEAYWVEEETKRQDEERKRVEMELYLDYIVTKTLEQAVTELVAEEKAAEAERLRIAVEAERHLKEGDEERADEDNIEEKEEEEASSLPRMDGIMFYRPLAFAPDILFNPLDPAYREWGGREDGTILRLTAPSKGTASAVGAHWWDVLEEDPLPEWLTKEGKIKVYRDFTTEGEEYKNWPPMYETIKILWQEFFVDMEKNVLFPKEAPKKESPLAALERELMLKKKMVAREEDFHAQKAAAMRAEVSPTNSFSWRAVHLKYIQSSTMMIPLPEGSVFTGEVECDQLVYFRVDVPKPKTALTILIKKLRGDVDTFVCKGALPAPVKYDFQSTTIDDIDQLTIAPSEKKGGKGSYVIGVYGPGMSSRFTISTFLTDVEEEKDMVHDATTTPSVSIQHFDQVHHRIEYLAKHLDSGELLSNFEQISHLADKYLVAYSDVLTQSRKTLSSSAFSRGLEDEDKLHQTSASALCSEDGGVRFKATASSISPVEEGVNDECLTSAGLNVMSLTNRLQTWRPSAAGGDEGKQSGFKITLNERRTRAKRSIPKVQHYTIAKLDRAFQS